MLKRSPLTPIASAVALALMAFLPLPATANGSFDPLELQFDAVGSDAADRTACLRLDNGRWNLKFEITGVNTGNSYLAVTLLDLTAYEDSLSSPKVERGLLQPIS
jgi:hypothetical protein